VETVTIEVGVIVVVDVRISRAELELFFQSSFRTSRSDHKSVRELSARVEDIDLQRPSAMDL